MAIITGFDTEDREKIVRLYRALQQGKGVTQERVEALVLEWGSRIQPNAKERSEDFALCHPNGETTGVVAPRWLCHVFGLRHRATEIALKTEQGLIVLQRRSPTVQDWANAPDMAVAGHIPQKPDGSDLSFLEGAWKEMEEEVGLKEENAERDLVEGRLLAVGAPYVSLDIAIERNPPFFNAEVRQIFAATLTGQGLANLHFPDNEVSGLLLVTPETAWSLLEHERIASGMRYSLPRYLDWLAQLEA
jgi:isopentenyldiphosphate isomerase